MIFAIRDASDLQPAIDDQQRLGGELLLPEGDIDSGTLYPFISAPISDAKRPLVVRGRGMLLSTLRLDRANAMLISYGKGGVNPKMAQLVFSDLTLDGNYAGAGGTFPQPASAVTGLIGAYNPFTAGKGYGTLPNGIFHEFRRVRFFRPQGFTFFPSQGVRCLDCLFDSVGQPDMATHADCLGSGDWTDALVDTCHWINSAGNYADFVGSDTGPVRITFRNNTSRNHKLGGLYACGRRSLVTGNDLVNVVPGGGVGYDSSTSAGGRSRNVVTGNSLVGMNVHGSLLSPTAYGDVVADNVADDTVA